MSTIQVEIQEFRKLQENTQTPGPKCNRCFYDIIWDKAYSESINGGRNKPFEMTKGAGHTCPIDQQNNYITRQGYTKDMGSGKVIWIGGGANPTQTKLPPSPPLQGISQGPDIYSIESLIKEQIGQLSQHYMAFQDEYKKIVQAQSQEILTLKGIITEYIAHNPTEGVLKTLVSELIRYMPEPALRPRSAAELKEALNITQKTPPETSSGYTRGEYQNQFTSDREAGFEESP